MQQQSHPSSFGNIVQTLEMPLKETKEGVFTAFLHLQMMGAQIIASIDNSDTDNRINELVDWLISTVPNQKFQQNLRKERDERIEKETKNIINNNEKGIIKKRINREIMGKVSSYMDIYAGGERENRISFVIPIKEMREVMQKANPKHFVEHLDELEIEKR